MILSKNLLLASALMAACLSCKSAKDETVVRVGRMPISREMVAVRSKIVVLPPGSLEPRELVATAELVRGYLSTSIATAYGAKISNESVTSLWKSQRENAPKILLDVEAEVNNPDLFAVAVVLPDFAGAFVRNYHRTSDNPHWQKSNKVQGILGRLLGKPETFDRVAAEEFATIDTLWIGANVLRSGKPAAGKIVLDAQPADQLQAAPEYGDLERETATDLYRKVSSVPVGGVYPFPMQTPDAFQIAKVLKREPGRALVSLMTIDKDSYETWYWNNAGNVPIEFPDHELGVAFLRNVPWAKHLLVRKEEFPEVFSAPTGR